MLRKRSDGRWEARVVIGYDEKGLPKTKNVLAKTKRECEAKLEKLKSEIQSLGIEDEKKDIIIQAILSTSVMDISMMTISSELSAVEKQKNIDAYHIYLQTFKSHCLAAIDKAVGEQKAVYAKIEDNL